MQNSFFRVMLPNTYRLHSEVDHHSLCIRIEAENDLVPMKMTERVTLQLNYLGQDK